jgi:hypothetical protein
MVQSTEDIYSKITSDDEHVLRETLSFVQVRLNEEVERRRSAEGRATAIIAILGILAGLVFPIGDKISDFCAQNRYALYVILGGALLFLLKGIFYALKIVGVGKQYRMVPELVYEFQEKSIQFALRNEVAYHIWVYNNMKGLNTERLFWLHRAQRNCVVTIFGLVAFGSAAISIQGGIFSFSTTTSVAFAVFAIAGLIFGDNLAESEWVGSIWAKREK